MKEIKMTVVPGDNEAFIKEKSNELLHALLVKKDRKAADQIIKNLNPCGDLGLVTSKQLKKE
jgi:hypothetical protein